MTFLTPVNFATQYNSRSPGPSVTPHVAVTGIISPRFKVSHTTWRDPATVLSIPVRSEFVVRLKCIPTGMRAFQKSSSFMICLVLRMFNDVRHSVLPGCGSVRRKLCPTTWASRLRYERLSYQFKWKYGTCM